jgi:dihydrodipicolinate synthase/N-acetylneuraminate lyase
MRTVPVQCEDLRGVFAVPPLARTSEARPAIDFEQNDLLARHILDGGIKRFLYGGNAFLYHITLAEYEQLLDWLNGFADDLWAIPSDGPSYGRAMDQALLLRRYAFPCVMLLPCADPRDIIGLERGYREIAEAANTRLMVYLKEENNLGADKEAGLEMVARLVDDGVCMGIKYAVVRQDPARDDYLDALLKRVDRRFVLSGIGERPAVTHLRDWKLQGFTTGSGCIAPRLTQMLFEACAADDFATAESLREHFLPLENLRDEWSPAKVLHFAAELSGIAKSGAVPPYLSALSSEQQQSLAPVAIELLNRNSAAETNSAHR